MRRGVGHQRYKNWKRNSSAYLELEHSPGDVNVQQTIILQSGEKSFQGSLSNIILALTLIGVACQAYLSRDTLIMQTDSNQRQLRAYVIFDKVEAALTPNNSNKLGVNRYLIKVSLRNGGMTPAYNVTYSIHSAVDDAGAHENTGDPSYAEAFFETKREPTRDLLPGGSISVKDDMRISNNDRHLLKEHKKSFFTWIVVKYRDTYQRCQVSKTLLRTSSVSGSKAEAEDIHDGASDPHATCADDPNGLGKRARQD